MATHLFKQPPPPPQNFEADPYGVGGLRVWDDYQFRRKGVRWGGGGPPVPVVPPVITVAPVNVVLPVIDGGLTQGQSLFCPEGTWTGTTPIAYAYQWYRVAVVAVAVPPSNVSIPWIFGPGIEEGQTLECPTGTWSGTTPLDYTYQWYRVVVLPPPEPGEVLTDEFGNPLTDEFGEELTT